MSTDNEIQDAIQAKIKLGVNNCYELIKTAEERLRELRSLCTHPNTFEGSYSHRVGSTSPATICSDCGECLKVHFYQYLLK